MEKNKKQMLLTTALCLLPILAGLLVYDRLPETVATHFGFNGEPNGWSSRPMAVFGLPAMMAFFNLVLHFGLNSDPKKANIDPKMRAIAVWTMPALAVICYGMTLANALGVDTKIHKVIPAIIGVMFILIGNYMPKTKRSYTTGIKLPWTLNSDENWNRTHRMAGFLWVVCGAAFLLCTLLQLWNLWLFLLLIGAMVLLPMVYSYLLYRKGI